MSESRYPEGESKEKENLARKISDHVSTPIQSSALAQLTSYVEKRESVSEADIHNRQAQQWEPYFRGISDPSTREHTPPDAAQAMRNTILTGAGQVLREALNTNTIVGLFNDEATRKLQAQVKIEVVLQAALLLAEQHNVIITVENVVEPKTGIGHPRASVRLKRVNGEY